MKTILLFRHSIKEGTGNRALSSEGIDLARKIGEDRLRGMKFTDFYVSTLERTGATMDAFELGAGDFPKIDHKVFPPHIEVSESPDAMTLWSGACQTAEEAGVDMMQAVLELEPDLSNKISSLAAKSFTRWVADLPEDSNVLVVGHSPFLELMAFGLFAEQLPQLQPCDSYSIIEDDKELRLNTEK
ncbi:histidine phosphatase family protein [Candidatus Uhrbacteria bacterium]|nr:histidine phosphatase family protein [Candidatus Uhrbacteria bacterium]